VSHTFLLPGHPVYKITNPPAVANSISPGSLGPSTSGTRFCGRPSSFAGANRSQDRRVLPASSQSPGLKCFDHRRRTRLLWIAGTNPLFALQPENRRTSTLPSRQHDPSTLCSGGVQRLLIDHRDVVGCTLGWSLSFNPLTQRFSTYKPTRKPEAELLRHQQKPTRKLWLAAI